MTCEPYYETENGTLYKGEFLEDDYRAREEFNTYMNKLNKEDSPKVLKREL